MDEKMSKKIGKRLRRNCIYISIILALIVGALLRNVELEAEIAPEPDSYILFSTDDSYMEQTWAPFCKRMTRVEVPYLAENTFAGVFKLLIMDQDKKNILREVIVSYEFVGGEEGKLCFDFDPIKVEIGQKYIIRFECLNTEEVGIVRIPIKDEFVGGIVNGAELNSAIGFKVIFVKNSDIFWSVFSFAPFLSFALALSVIFEKRLEETLALAFLLIGLLLNMMGMLGYLEIGIYLVYIVAVGCLLGAMFLSHRKRIDSIQLVTPGVIIWGIMMVYIMYTCRAVQMKWYDEYSHWGLAARDMFSYNKLSMHVDSTVMATRYQPFSTLIEYFFLYINEMFSEGIVYVAYSAIVLALMLPLYKNCKWKHPVDYIVCTVVVVCMPLVFFSQFFKLYVDFLLGMLFAYVLLCYFGSELSKFNCIRICCGLIALVMTKDMGLVLAGLAVFAIVIDILYQEWKKRKKLYCDKKDIIKILLFLGCTIIPFILWQLYIAMPKKTLVEGEITNATVNSSITASNVSVNGLTELIGGGASEYKYVTVINFFKCFFNGDTYYIGKIPISCFGVIIIVLLWGIILGYKKYGSEDGRSVLRFDVIGCIIFCLYSMALLVLYLFAFSEGEAVALESHERYLASCLIGIAFVHYGLVMFKKQENKKRSKVFTNLFMITVAGILILSVPIERFTEPENERGHVHAHEIEACDDIAKMLRTVCDRKDSVYYIYSNKSNLQYLVFKSKISPVNTLLYGGSDIYASNEYFEKEMAIVEEPETEAYFPQIMTLEEWKNELRGYEYVFIHHPSSYFGEMYGELFEEPQTIGDKTFYKVDFQNQGMRLCYIGKLN